MLQALYNAEPTEYRETGSSTESNSSVVATRRLLQAGECGGDGSLEIGGDVAGFGVDISTFLPECVPVA